VNKDWRPRLNIDISKRAFNIFQRHLPTGVKGKVYRVVMEELADALEKAGPDLVAALVNKWMRLEEISPTVGSVLGEKSGNDS